MTLVIRSQKQALVPSFAAIMRGLRNAVARSFCSLVPL